MAVNIETAIKYMYDLKAKNIRYSMTGSRTGSDGTGDCSGTIYEGLRRGGATDTGWVLNTDSMHSWLVANGFSLIAENQEWSAKRGDIVIFGLKGASGGAAGHVVIFISNTQIIHCTWKSEWANGVYVDNEATTCPYSMGWYVYRQKTSTPAPTPKPSQPKISQGIAKPGKGLFYRAHIPNQGWLGYVGSTQTAGTTGKAIPIQAVEVLWNGIGDLITSKAHVAGIGWKPWNYNVTGTTGQNRNLEAVQFWLGEYLTKQGYSIEYRTHVAKLGWQSWVKDGAISGTTGKKLAIEAIEFRMRKNGKLEVGKFI